VFHDENQNWEEEIQQRASALMANRFSALQTEVRRLQSTLNETCERLLGQTMPAASTEETESLRDHFRQMLNAATATATQNFQTQLAQARQEAAANLRELQQELENSRQEIEAARQTETSRQSLAISTQAATPVPGVGFDLLKTAVEEIDAQRTQSDALSTLVHRAAQFAPRIVFFVVKSGSAIGWKATGFTNGLNDEAVRSLSVPTNIDTLLREALDRQGTAVGGQYSHHENSAILGRYGTPAPEQAVAVPLVVRGKAAAVLYADASTQSGSAINLEALEALLRVTSMAIELLPVRRGAEQTRPAAPPPQETTEATSAPPSPPSAVMPTVFYGGMGDEAPARIEPAFQAETPQQSFAQATPAMAPTMPAPSVEERGEAATATATAWMSSEAPAPQATSSEAPSTDATNEADVRAHNDARRFARLLVSEIKLYNEAKVSEGRRSCDLYDRLKDDIDRSRQMYEKRVSPLVAAKFDYFYDELVHTLGEGDLGKLGSRCPGPTVSV
jgi:hypothetical protein